jgi:uncharacterized Zn finger protein
MDADSLSMSLTPHGRLVLIENTDGAGLDATLADSLRRAFGRGSGHGLLWLGADAAGATLRPVHGYWREFGARYSDYENRLPRGRTYVRNGSVIDLQIEPGAIHACVSGSELYKVELRIEPAARAKWKSICHDFTGAIDSLVELLQGRLSSGVMERICRQDQGLFPTPREIHLDCSCPDWAGMCTHVATVLYGVGARLDHEPRLLFRLRNVDELELIASVGQAAPLTSQAPAAAKLLGGEDLSALFGLALAKAAGNDARRASADTPPNPPKPVRTKRAKETDRPYAKKSVARKPTHMVTIWPAAKKPTAPPTTPAGKTVLPAVNKPAATTAKRAKPEPATLAATPKSTNPERTRKAVEAPVLKPKPPKKASAANLTKPTAGARKSRRPQPE